MMEGSVLTIANTPGEALPVTGGSGTAPLYALGVALVAGGALILRRCAWQR